MIHGVGRYSRLFNNMHSFGENDARNRRYSDIENENEQLQKKLTDKVKSLLDVIEIIVEENRTLKESLLVAEKRQRFGARSAEPNKGYGAGGDYYQYKGYGAGGNHYQYKGYGAGGDNYQYRGYGAGGDNYQYKGYGAGGDHYQYKGYGAGGDNYQYKGYSKRRCPSFVNICKDCFASNSKILKRNSKEILVKKEYGAVDIKSEVKNCKEKLNISETDDAEITEISDSEESNLDSEDEAALRNICKAHFGKDEKYEDYDPKDLKEIFWSDWTEVRNERKEKKKLYKMHKEKKQYRIDFDKSRENYQTLKRKPKESLSDKEEYEVEKQAKVEIKPEKMIKENIHDKSEDRKHPEKVEKSKSSTVQIKKHTENIVIENATGKPAFKSKHKKKDKEESSKTCKDTVLNEKETLKSKKEVKQSSKDYEDKVKNGRLNEEDAKRYLEQLYKGEIC